MPVNDAFLHLSARFYSQDWYLASQNLTKIYQKCIRPRVRAVLTEQIFSSPKALPAGHTGSISKGRDKGIGKICTSKPTWFGSRAAKAKAGWRLAWFHTARSHERAVWPQHIKVSPSAKRRYVYSVDRSFSEFSTGVVVFFLFGIITYLISPMATARSLITTVTSHRPVTINSTGMPTMAKRTM